MNKGTKSFTSGNKIELHRNKIIYGTKSYTWEQNWTSQGTKKHQGENLFMELIFWNKRNKPLWIEEQKDICLGTKMNFIGNKK
jgi:hypothetical protein